MNYHTSPAFSFTGSKNYDFVIPNSSPGPKYNYKINDHDQIATKIGKSKRSVMGLSHTPNPGRYEHQVYTTEHQKFSIPKAKKQQLINNFQPGPGDYDPSDQQVKKRSLTFTQGYKFKSYFDDQSKRPGPGHYEVYNKNLTTHKISKIGTGERPSLERDPTIPGVGNYQIHQNIINNKQTIGKSQRPKIMNKNPGPGQYQIQFHKKDGITLSSKLFLKPHQSYLQNPGPHYNVAYKNSNPAFTIGHQKRENNQFFINNQTPGPLDYNTKIQQIIKQSSGTIPKAKLNDLFVIENTPGPGSYQIASKLKSSYTIPRSQSLHYNSHFKNPSPAQYNILTNDSKKQLIKIGNSQRTNFINRNQLGPGDYNIGGDIAKSNGKSIGKSSRKQQKNVTPGPAHYIISSTIANLNKYSVYKNQNS